MKSHQRLNLYVNPKWRRPEIHTPLINPWWGNALSEASFFTKRAFDTFSFDTNSYLLTEKIEEADLVLVPYPHRWLIRHDEGLLRECVTMAKEAGIPLLIDGWGDVENPIGIENAYVMRYGGYRFLPEPGRLQIPLFVDDLLLRYVNGVPDIRKKITNKPVIGFVGWATLTREQAFRTIIKELPVRIKGIFDERYRACIKGIWWRQKAIRLLKRSPLIDFNFHARQTFSGTTKTAQGDMKKLQTEMVENILQSDYALDVRGDANNSARFFEILSLGRIPVIIDTERNFPFFDKIDYSTFSLIVNFRDIKKLPEIVSEFHKNISPERFIQMQKNARNAFVNYFRIDAVMQLIFSDLGTRIATTIKNLVR